MSSADAPMSWSKQQTKRSGVFIFRSRSKKESRSRSGRRSSRLLDSPTPATKVAGNRTSIASKRTSHIRNIASIKPKKTSTVRAAATGRRTSTTVHETENRITSGKLRSSSGPTSKLVSSPFQFTPHTPSSSMSLPKKQRSNTHLYQTEDVPQGSRSFFSRLTSRFRSKKRPSLSIDPAATAPPAQHAVPGSASSPNVIHSPTIFALVDATASLSTTSLPCMLASRAPTESRVESEARDPSVHRVRADSSGSMPRSMSRGRQARGTPGDDEYAPNSPTLRTLPPSPLVAAFPPTTDVEDGKTEGETKETDGASTSQSPTVQSGTPLPQTPLHIHTSPSLVFSDSDDGTTQSVLSPLTPLAGNTASDFTSGRSGSQSTHTTRDSLPPVDIVLSDALKDEQCITAELLSPTQPEKAPPTLVVSIPTETASEKVDGAKGSSVSPIRARSLVVVEEDEEEGAEGAKEQQQVSPGAAGLGVRLQTQENAERTRKLSETSVNGESVTPKRAAPVKRSSTFAMLTRGPSMLFGRREKLATQPVRPTTFYATSTPTQDTLAPATTTRKASLMKTNQSRRALPVRAQTVHSVMSNVEIGKQMDGFLNTKSSLESQGVDASKVAPAAKTMIVTSPIIDQETQHLTEVAFF